MLTKYLTAVTTAFSPFNPRSGKTARNFLALLPPNARQTMNIDVQLLGQAQKNTPATMALKFSEFGAPPAETASLANRGGSFSLEWNVENWRLIIFLFLPSQRTARR